MYYEMILIWNINIINYNDINEILMLMILLLLLYYYYY